MDTITLPAAVVLDALNAARRGSRPILAPTVVRRARDGHWWLMSGRERGWDRFGYRYESLWVLASEWSLDWVALGRDEHSELIEVRPHRGNAG